MTTVSSIQSLPRNLQLEVLSPAASDRVHGQTLEILERVGIALPSTVIREALGRAGAEVDHARERVRFSEKVVEEALAAVLAAPVLAARVEAQDLVLDRSAGFLSVDGNAAEILDPETEVRRASTKEDLARLSRLADGLDEIGLLWQPVTARDVAPETHSLHELHAQVLNTTKHIQMMTAVTPEAAEGVVEIARVVAGGADALRRRPLVSAFQCSLSPLAYEAGTLEAARIYAEAGIPCGFVVMPISCATAPATAGGLLVQSNAEALAGVVALELLAPGAATFYGSCATAMDLRTGAAACGGPEDLYLQMASAQMAQRYNLPALIGTFATGAKAPDWQAGVENGMSALVSCLAGADLLCGAGLVYGARVFSEIEMVLDCEIFGLVRHLVSDVTLDIDADLPEVIAEFGPAGHFLAAPHTLANMRRQWMPRLFDRATWEEWEAADHRGPRAAAAERAAEILGSHTPEPLDEAIDREIVRIIDAYER